MSSAPAYLVARRRVRFAEAEGNETDVLFANERLDEQRLSGRVFEHCTFSNVSFKDVELRECRFTNCAFIACYFRRTRILSCSFVGSKFIGCDFPKPTVQSSDFKYARFENCAISFDEMQHSLPSEPNLREDLAACLAIASEERGFGPQARRYRLAAIKARDEHLLAAVLGKSGWYKTHYEGTRRLGAGLRLVGSTLNGALWGHGERWSVLLRNLLFASLVLFPALLWWRRAGLQVVDGGVPGAAQIVWLSVTTTIPVAGINTVVATEPATRALLTFEAFLGIVIAGLFVTLLVRAGLRK